MPHRQIKEIKRDICLSIQYMPYLPFNETYTFQFKLNSWVGKEERGDMEI